MAEKRDPVKFEPNEPEKLTFEFDGGRESTTRYGIRTMYSLMGNRVLFASEDLAAKINFCDPKRGMSLWVTRQVMEVRGSKRKKYASSWVVNIEEPGTIQRRNEFPDTQANAEATGIEETQLEREMRETHELVQQRAQTNGHVKENLERQELPAPAIAAEPKRPGWYDPIVDTTNHAIDALAECRRHAEQHGQRITAEDVRSLLVTVLINKREKRA